MQETEVLKTILTNGSTMAVIILSWLILAILLFFALQKVYMSLLKMTQDNMTRLIEQTQEAISKVSDSLQKLVENNNKSNAELNERLARVDIHLETIKRAGR